MSSEGDGRRPEPGIGGIIGRLTVPVVLEVAGLFVVLAAVADVTGNQIVLAVDADGFSWAEFLLLWAEGVPLITGIVGVGLLAGARIGSRPSPLVPQAVIRSAGGLALLLFAAGAIATIDSFAGVFTPRQFGNPFIPRFIANLLVSFAGIVVTVGLLARPVAGEPAQPVP